MKFEYVNNDHDPLVHIDKDGTVIINESKPESIVFNDVKNNEKAVKRELIKAIIAASPDNKRFNQEELDDEYDRYTLV